MPRSLAVVSILATCGYAMAGPFTAGSIVVMRVSTANPGGSGAIVLEEFSKVSGAALGNSVAIASTGPLAVSLPDIAAAHDRHLHRSTDGRFLIFAAYGIAPSAIDPTPTAAASTPRVIGIVGADGAADLSTRLADCYDFTAIRGAASTDGVNLWLAGDNASGGVVNGGLRFAIKGSASTVNLSQVQSQGQPHTPDNVRDVGIFAGQLYDCSGSNASIGKGVFQVGVGLPTSGSQTLSPALNGNDGASASSFVLLDVNPTEPGVDVLYTAASAGGEGFHKYVKQAGTWVSRGFVGFAGVEHVIAEPQPDGSVDIYASSYDAVCKFNDVGPISSTISGTIQNFLITAPAGWSIGGIDFAPAAASCYPNCDGSTSSPRLTANDFQCFLNEYAAGHAYANCDNSTSTPILTANDFQCFLNAFAVGCS